METGPSKMIERLIGLLIPPACREHVLGDLRETSASSAEYLLNALSLWPMVVASRIRRMFDPALALFEGFFLYSAFMGVAVLGGWARVMHINGGWVWLLVPVNAAVLALRIADAYADPDRNPPLRPLMQGAMAAAAALAASVFVPLPFQGLLTAALISIGVVASLRWVMHWGDIGVRAGTSPQPALRSLDEIPARARAFESRIRARNLRETLGAVLVVLGFGWQLFYQPPPLIQAACVLNIAATGFVMFVLHRRGAAAKWPENMPPEEWARAYREELAVQRDLLSGIWTWYLTPFVPGLALFVLNAMLTAPQQWPAHIVFAAIFILALWSIGALNLAAARKLQREIDAIDGLMEQR